MSGAVGAIPVCSGEASSFYGTYVQVDTNTDGGVDPTAAQWPTSTTKPISMAHWPNWPNNGTANE
jgi:hypothetical protein